MNLIDNVFKKLFGYCVCCDRYFKYPKRRRINTAYEDDSMNYTRQCKECYDATIAYYEEMWADYYASRL